MLSKGENDTATRLTLGKYLASIRADRKFTLRGVEEATDKEVSNDKIKQPSPNILHTLSELYGISFEKLMQMAGYFVEAAKRQDKDRHGRVATFAEHNLTLEEETELLEYLEFLRRKRKKAGDKT